MTPCPPPEQLERLIREQLPAAQAAEVERHIAACIPCQQVLERLTHHPRNESIQSKSAGSGVLSAADAAFLLALENKPGLSGAAPASSAGPELPDRFDFLAPPQDDGEIGWLAHYRVLRLLGKGGMGMVFHAEDSQLRRPVALKVLHPDSADDLAARQRFLREARAAAALKNDHIVTIYQVGQDRDTCFLAMEFLQGEPLDERLRRGPVPLAEIIRIGRETAMGLAAAHEHGLIHRDIKPANVWLELPAGRVKILDFGLVQSAKDDMRLTQSGFIVGTVSYMAPEQARCGPLDGRTDLFSLGCLLYRLCAGEMPFKGEETMAVLTALAVDEPRPVGEANAAVPPALNDLVMRLLAKRPEDRPASAREVIDALDAVGESLTASGAIPLALPLSSIQSSLTDALPGAAVRSALGPDERTRSLVPAAQPEGFALGSRRRKAGQVLLVGSLILIGGTGLGYVLRGRDAGPVAHHSGSGSSKAATGASAKPGSEEPWMKGLASRPRAEQLQAVAEQLKQRNPDFSGAFEPIEEKARGQIIGMKVASDGITDLSPLRVLAWLEHLQCNGNRPTELTDLKPLSDLKLRRLELAGNGKLSDLQPLHAMKSLQVLNLNYTGVSDLKPLAGLSLRDITFWNTAISDLEPLRNMPLTRVGAAGTRVRDIAALGKSELGWLEVQGTAIVDFTPLRELPLHRLNADIWTWRDEDCLADIPSLKFINGQDSAEAHKEWMSRRKALLAWAEEIAAQGFKDQEAALLVRLRELNPKLTMTLRTEVENGSIVELRIKGAGVANLGPVRALPKLKRLHVEATAAQRNMLSDLSPLRGTILEELDCSQSEVYDLKPLAMLPLRRLNIAGTKVSDLRPLLDLKLEHIDGNFTLAGAKLLQTIPTLKTINGKPAADFGK